MSRKRRVEHRVRASVGQELYERLLREAASRRISVSHCIRMDLEKLYAIRDELSQPIEVARSAGAAKPRLIHRLLAETETRLAADLDRHLAEVGALGDAVRRLEAMLDRQYVGLMLYLPDVADELHDDQAKVALRRYEAWRRAVEKLLDGDNRLRSRQLGGRSSGAITVRAPTRGRPTLRRSHCLSRVETPLVDVRATLARQEDNGPRNPK